MKKRKIEEQVLAEATLLLKEIERRKALVKYKKEHGIGLKGFDRKNLLGILADPDTQQRTIAIVLDDQFTEIIHAFWANINSPHRTNAILGHHLDHFYNEIRISRQVGIESLCFIQEGYIPPTVGVDLYFDPDTREGIEAQINRMGEIVFLDIEINQVWPQGIRKLLQGSILAHYQAITCPRLSEEESDDDGGKGLEGPGQSVIKSRRAHLRRLPLGYHASLIQLALAVAQGKFSEEEVNRIIAEGRHITFVRELFPQEEQDFTLSPRHLLRSDPIKFFNTFMTLIES